MKRLNTCFIPSPVTTNYIMEYFSVQTKRYSFTFTRRYERLTIIYTRK